MDIEIKELPIEGFEGYTITNSGVVYSFKRGRKKPLKYSTDEDGYFRCTLYKDSEPYYFRINRLVALTFIPNPYNLPLVNHKDGCKTNNWDYNLEWVTNKENNDHATMTGLHNLNKWIIQKDMTGKRVGRFYSTRKAQDMTGVDGSCISKVCKGQRKQAGGFLWEFEEEDNEK